jgi:ELWxxDGT repeat protein
MISLSSAIADEIIKIYHIQPATQGANPSNGIILQNKLLFTVSNFSGRIQLWQIDSTHSAKMICDSLSNPFSFFILKNQLYFFTKGSQGSNLWHYNGYESPGLLYDSINCNTGTKFTITGEKIYFYGNQTGKIITDGLFQFDGINHPEKIANNPVTRYVNTLKVINFNDKIFFSSNHSLTGNELWCYDKDSSWMVADIYPGSGSSNPGNFKILNQKLYFYVNDKELWEYNGTDSPKFIANVNPESKYFRPEITQCNGIIYFNAIDSLLGNSLWSYDGYSKPVFVNGTENVYPSELLVFNEKLYFKADNSLFEFDGINEPYRFLDGQVIDGPFIFDNSLFCWYTECDSNSSKTDLFRYDGINPAVNLTSAENFYGYIQPKLVNIDDRLFFFVLNKIYQILEDSVRMISNQFPSDFKGISQFQNKYYLSSYCKAYGGELWTFDGRESPVLYKDFNKEMIIPITLKLKEVRDKLFFSYYSRNEFIQYNNDSFTVLPPDFNPVTVYNLFEYNNNYYYNRESGKTSSSLFKYDGTKETMLSNMAVSNLMVYHDTIYYCSLDNCLLKYDGIHSPSIVANLNPNRVFRLVNFKEKLILFGDDNNSLSIALYDGKVISYLYQNVPTHITKNFPCVLFRDNYIFSSSDNRFGSELWIFDEYHEPKMMADIYPGIGGSDPGDMVVFKNKLYFSAMDNIHGRELWVYDGENPPSMVADIEEGSGSSNPQELSVTSDKIYFKAFKNNSGYELWEFDGENEPAIIEDLCKGTCSSNPADLTVYRDKLYFSAINNNEGRQLFTVCKNCSSIITSACDSMQFNGQILKQSGKYYDTIPGNQSQDSILILDLTVLNSTKNELNFTTCDEFISPGGKYKWTTSGVYYDTIPNACGCDSILDITLQIDHVDTAINVYQNLLVSADPNASHQWIDYDNGYALIVGQTNVSYFPDLTGRYAVIVTQGTCVDTSSAYLYIITGNQEFSDGIIHIYPNPNNGRFTIDLGKAFEEADIAVLTPTGQVVQELKLKNSQKQEIELNEVSGMYLVRITTSEGRRIIKAFKQ